MRGTGIFALLALAASASGADTNPVKLGVHPDRTSTAPGEILTVSVQLLNSSNQPAVARKPFPVLLQIRMPSKAILPLGKVTIDAGQSSATLRAPLGTSGLEYIWARNNELISGGAFVNVRAAANPAPAASAPPPPPPPIRSGRQSEIKRNAPAPQLPNAVTPQITLRFSPQRSFLADGKDAANVEAFLLEPDVYASDIRLNVFGSSSNTNPLLLTIPRGQSSGTVALTSGEPGTVRAEFLSSEPNVSLDGDKALSIHFGAPITHLRLTSSPPRLSLVETATIFATLVDEHDTSQNTDTPRDVAFSIVSGKGQLDNQVIQIPAGQSESHVVFHPVWPGPLNVSAATANLLTAETPVQVTVPVALLLCTALGGLAGGLLASTKPGKGRQWRPLIGMITGFVLYWFCVFIGLSSVGRGIVLNPLTAIAISTIGGWVQTSVLTSIWGTIAPKAASKG